MDQPPASVDGACPECGAPRLAASCQERLHALLERSFAADAAYGLAVACHMLQHPARQTDRALQWAHFHLTVALRQGLTPEQARQTARARFDQHRDRVATGAVAAVRRPIRWRATIALLDAPAGAGSVRDWAEAV